MRIGILTHNYPLNSEDRKDAGVFLRDFAQELSKKNDVFILTPNFSGKKEKYMKVPVTWFDWKGGNKKLGNLSIVNPAAIVQFISLLWSGSKAAVKFVEDNNLDLLIGAWSFPSGFFAYWAHRKTRIRYVTWSLGSDIHKYIKVPLIRQLTLLALNNASVRFANSYTLCDEVKLLTNKRCIFLPAVTNLKPPKVTVKKSHRGTNFVYIGRLEKVKGVDILIEAAKSLPRNKPWHLRIGGDGILDQSLRSAVIDSDLQSHVTFLGRLDAKGVMKEMIDADYLVVPSRSESLPLVILEASNFSLPIIASDVGDCKRIITKYHVGYVFPHENTKQLAQVMKNVIMKPKDKKEYLSGMRKLSEEFTQKNTILEFNQYVKN